MNRRLVLCLVFTLGLSPVLASAQPATPPPMGEPATPPWVPRGALFGTFIRGGVVGPTVRVNWQLEFFRGRRDYLALFVEPQAAAAVIKPESVVTGSTVPLSSLQFYSLLFAVGYRNRNAAGVEWGFQLGTGPVWYAARFSGGAKSQESYLVGLLDGRAQIGYRFGPLSLGVAVGYGDPYNYKRTSLASPYVGGLQLGVYGEWR